MTTRVHVDEHMLISAVRYALGRATYIVGITVGEVIDAWPHLSMNTRSVIHRDVTDYLDRCEGKPITFALDNDQWARITHLDPSTKEQP